jgi:hypothetical protein
MTLTKGRVGKSAGMDRRSARVAKEGGVVSVMEFGQLSEAFARLAQSFGNLFVLSRRQLSLE